jgi:hypothetical protein
VAGRTQDFKLPIGTFTKLLLLLTLSTFEIITFEDILLYNVIWMQQTLSLLRVSLLILFNQITKLIFIQDLLVLVDPFEFSFHPVESLENVWIQVIQLQWASAVGESVRLLIKSTEII